ncbi:MAG: hypothetical protein V3U62_07455, partial [Sedimenticolaceae bacterium]
TVFYLDPPYWGTTGYGSDFTFDNYAKMAELASSCSGKLVISINDHPDIREVFNEFKCQSIPITYTVGGSTNAAKRRELIITS